MPRLFVVRLGLVFGRRKAVAEAAPVETQPGAEEPELPLPMPNPLETPRAEPEPVRAAETPKP